MYFSNNIMTESLSEVLLKLDINNLDVGNCDIDKLKILADKLNTELKEIDSDEGLNSVAKMIKNMYKGEDPVGYLRCTEYDVDEEDCDVCNNHVSATFSYRKKSDGEDDDSEFYITFNKTQYWTSNAGWDDGSGLEIWPGEETVKYDGFLRWLLSIEDELMDILE